MIKESLDKLKMDNPWKKIIHNELIPAYHKSKQFYLTRKRTYISFVTIIRQLCKLNSVNYKSNISYTKSTYDIVYNIRNDSAMVDLGHPGGYEHYGLFVVRNQPPK